MCRQPDPRVWALLYLGLGCVLVYGIWNTTEPLQIWLVGAWSATPAALLMIPGVLARKAREETRAV